MHKATWLLDTGRFIGGNGPNMETLLSRIKIGHTPSPVHIARMIQGGVAGTPMYEEPIIHGDRETVQRKKRSNTVNTSHRPGFVMESKRRKPRGRPRKLQFENQQDMHHDDIFEDLDIDMDVQEIGASLHQQSASVIFEENMERGQWALRRMPPHCIRRCFGMIGKKRCLNMIQSHTPGLVAPCFWSQRKFKDQTISQWMWFCSHDAGHTQKVNKQVIEIPVHPSTWPVDFGTKIT